MELIEGIKTRRSIREFLDKDIPDDVIKKLIDAARHAPSSKDSQPWEFIVIKDQATKEAIADQRSEDNQVERRAKALIVVAINLDKSSTRWIEDGSLAAQNLALVAHEQGLSAVWTTAWPGYGKESSVIEKIIKEKLSLPTNIRPVCILALGYPSKQPEQKQLRNLDEIIHYEKW